MGVLQGRVFEVGLKARASPDQRNGTGRAYHSIDTLTLDPGSSWLVFPSKPVVFRVHVGVHAVRGPCKRTRCMDDHGWAMGFALTL